MRLYLCLLLFVVGILFVTSTPIDKTIKKRFLFSDEPAEEEPEPDWNTLNFQEIKLDTKEIELKPKDLYSKIQECIEKCMKNVNSDFSIRDNCIAKICDIY